MKMVIWSLVIALCWAWPTPALELMHNLLQQNNYQWLFDEPYLLLNNGTHIQVWDLQRQRVIGHYSTGDKCQMTVEHHQLIRYCPNAPQLTYHHVVDGRSLSPAEVTAQRQSWPPSPLPWVVSNQRIWLKVWDVKTGKLSRQIPLPVANFNNLSALKVTGHLAVIQLQNHQTLVYDWSTGQLLHQFWLFHELNSGFVQVGFGKLATYRHQDNTVWVMDLLTGQWVTRIQGNRRDGVGGYLPPLQGFVGAANNSVGGAMNVPTATGTWITMQARHYSDVFLFALFGSYLLTDVKTHIYIWDLQTGKYQRAIPKTKANYQVIHAPGLNHIFMTEPTNDNISFVDFQTGQQTGWVEQTCPNMHHVKYNGEHVIVSSYDATLRLYDPTGQLQHTLNYRPDRITHFATDGPLTATQTDNSPWIEVWNTHNQQHLHSIQTHNQELKTIALEHQHLLTVGADQELLVWDIHQNQPISRICDYMEPPTAWALQYPQLLLGFGNPDAPTLALYDAATGQKKQTFNGPPEKINQLAVSEGQFIVDSDSMTQRLELPSGQLIAMGTEHNKRDGPWQTSIKSLTDCLKSLRTNPQLCFQPRQDHLGSRLVINNQRIQIIQDQIGSWDTTTGKQKWVLPHRLSDDSRAFVRKGKLFFYQTSGSFEPRPHHAQFTVLDLKTGQLPLQLNLKKQRISGIEIKYNRLFVRTSTGFLIYDANAFQPIAQITGINGKKLSLNQDKIVLHSSAPISQPHAETDIDTDKPDFFLTVWDLRTGKLLWQKELGHPIEGITSQKSQLIVRIWNEANDADENLCLDLHTGEPVAPLPEPSQPAPDFGWVNGESLLKYRDKVITKGWPNVIRLYNRDSHQLLKQIYPGRFVQMIVYQDRLVVFLVDGLLKIYDLNTFQQLATLHGQQTEITSVSVSGQYVTVTGDIQRAPLAKPSQQTEPLLNQVWDLKKLRKIKDYSSFLTYSMELNHYNPNPSPSNQPHWEIHTFPEGAVIWTRQGYYAGIGNYRQYAHVMAGSRIFEWADAAATLERPDLVWQIMQGKPIPVATLE